MEFFNYLLGFLSSKASKYIKHVQWVIQEMVEHCCNSHEVFVAYSSGGRVCGERAFVVNIIFILSSNKIM